MAVVVLLHDLATRSGLCGLWARTTPNAVAALLTILGYSLYDTVVVFHRIVDNMKESRETKNVVIFMTMAKPFDQSSVDPNYQQLIAHLAHSCSCDALLLAVKRSKTPAFGDAVGLIAGSYSSIAVATPLYARKSREPKYKKPDQGAWRFDRSVLYTSGLGGRNERAQMALRWLWMVLSLRMMLNQRRLRRSKLNLQLSRRTSLSATRERKRMRQASDPDFRSSRRRRNDLCPFRMRRAKRSILSSGWILHNDCRYGFSCQMLNMMKRQVR